MHTMRRDDTCRGVHDQECCIVSVECSVTQPFSIFLRRLTRDESWRMRDGVAARDVSLASFLGGSYVLVVRRILKKNVLVFRNEWVECSRVAIRLNTREPSRGTGMCVVTRPSDIPSLLDTPLAMHTIHVASQRRNNPATDRASSLCVLLLVAESETIRNQPRRPQTDAFSS